MHHVHQTMIYRASANKYAAFCMIMAYNNVLFVLWDECATPCPEQLEPIMTWKTQRYYSTKKTAPVLKSPLGSAKGIFQKIRH